jgi:hypothetical protein
MTAMRLGAMVAMLVVGGAVSPARAQAPSHDWSDGTSVNLFGGVAADGDGAGGLAGAGAGWMVTPTFGLEGQVGWSDGIGGADTFAAALVARCSPRRARPVVPFVKAGIGLYRASFAAASMLPRFYSRRLAADDPARSRAMTMIDPSILAGAGFDLFASRHVSIRPEVDVTLVLDAWRGYPVTTATVHVVYHFEAKRVTP